MKSSPIAPSTISDYIAGFPQEVQAMLEKLRQTIRDAAPDATEKISYQMPTYYLNGNLVHFAAYANHIGFYPTPSAIVAFEAELKQYKTSKGAIQFPLDTPLPLALITKIVKYRVAENIASPAKARTASVAAKEFFADGSVSGAGKLKAGKRHGKWTFYFKNGGIKAVGKYVNGELDGYWEWWRENGEPLQAGSFAQGIQVGMWVRYYDNGQLWDEGEFANGKKVGEWKIYEKTGALKQRKIYKIKGG